MDNTDLPTWLAVLTTIIGSGAGVTLVSWVLKKLDKRDHVLTREDLDKALRESPTMLEVQSKLDRDFRRLEDADADRKALRRDVLRIELFAHTQSRNQHERQLEAGREYLQLGGNGLGHVRFNWLSDDYEQRMKNSDWDYSKSHHTD